MSERPDDDIWYEVTSISDFDYFMRWIDNFYDTNGKRENHSEYIPKKFPCIVKFSAHYGGDYADSISYDYIYQNKDGIYEIMPKKDWGNTGKKLKQWPGKGSKCPDCNFYNIKTHKCNHRDSYNADNCKYVNESYY